MTLALGLLLNGLSLAVLGPLVLEHAARRLPAGMAITAWSAAMGLLLVSWFTAAALTGVLLLQAEGHLDQLLVGCLAQLESLLNGDLGIATHLGLAGLATLLLVVVAVLLGRLVLVLGRARARTHQHSHTARLVSERRPGPGGALLVDSPKRCIYCVAGRPAEIVVTTAALDALDDEQLAAVLAHERAHLAERHHLLLAASRAAAASLPCVRLLRVGAATLARLVEIRADDIALRHHRPTALVGALLALSDSGSHDATALGASSVGVVERVERLLLPTTTDTTPSSLGLTLAATALLIGPATSTSLLSAAATLCQLLLS